MSFNALMNATLATLNTYGKFTKDVMVAFTPGPMPPRNIGGSRFVSIHPANWDIFSESPSGYGELDEVFSIAITLTFALNTIPYDRVVKQNILQPITGLETLARRVVKVMTEKNIFIMEAANTLLANPIHRIYKPGTENDPDTQPVPSVPNTTYVSHTDEPYESYSPVEDDVVPLVPPGSASTPVIGCQFISPLKFEGSLTGFQETPSGWFSDDDKDDDRLGIYITLNFGGARRIQSIFVDKGIF